MAAAATGHPCPRDLSMRLWPLQPWASHVFLRQLARWHSAPYWVLRGGRQGGIGTAPAPFGEGGRAGLGRTRTPRGGRERDPSVKKTQGSIQTSRRLDKVKRASPSSLDPSPPLRHPLSNDLLNMIILGMLGAAGKVHRELIMLTESLMRPMGQGCFLDVMQYKSYIDL